MGLGCLIIRQRSVSRNCLFGVSISVKDLAGAPLRSLLKVVLAASFILPSALAEPRLSPGKPAGIKTAMATSEKREMYILAAIVVASAGVAIALVGPKKSTATTSTNP